MILRDINVSEAKERSIAKEQQPSLGMEEGRGRIILKVWVTN